MASAIGESARHSGEIAAAAATNTSDATATNAAAARCVMRPRGISRIAVRGFFAS